jgi:hypothetical protein
VADCDVSTETGQPLGERGQLCVGAGYDIAQVQKKFGDAAHPDPADAYKVDPLNLPEHRLPA